MLWKQRQKEQENIVEGVLSRFLQIVNGASWKIFSSHTSIVCFTIEELTPPSLEDWAAAKVDRPRIKNAALDENKGRRLLARIIIIHKVSEQWCEIFFML